MVVTIIGLSISFQIDRTDLSFSQSRAGFLFHKRKSDASRRSRKEIIRKARNLQRRIRKCKSQRPPSFSCRYSAMPAAPGLCNSAFALTVEVPVEHRTARRTGDVRWGGRVFGHRRGDGVRALENPVCRCCSGTSPRLLFVRSI